MHFTGPVFNFIIRNFIHCFSAEYELLRFLGYSKDDMEKLAEWRSHMPMGKVQFDTKLWPKTSVR